MEAAPVVGYTGDALDPQHHRTRAPASNTSPRGAYPASDAQDHLRARRTTPSSGRMEVGAAASAAAAATRGSAGQLTEAQSARRRNHTKSIGHYILGKTIGEGTFGKVKLGTHILTGEKVAVKVLEKERIIDVADVERVAREVYILKLIRHQHVVQLYEIIETSRQLYLIMEYASGGELFDYIVASGRIQEPEACRFFRQIVEGVEEIHKMNVVHRDLKPENLLLDEHCDIKIVDFGLSNTYRDGQLLKTACGSPCYAAPEMIAGKEYVPSLCDIWSCGVILFAMLCGYLPFEDQNTAALYRKILAAEYTLPDFLGTGARDLISGMLTTDPTRRLTSATLRQLPWFSIGKEEENTSRARNSEMRYFEEDILEELEKFGFPPDYTQRCLRMNKHNHVTTTYHLLERKKQRMMDQVMLDQVACQEQFNLSGLDQASNTSQGASLRVGCYDGRDDGQGQGEDYNTGNNSARHAANDGTNSARGASGHPRSNYTGPTTAARPGNSPTRGSTPTGGTPTASTPTGGTPTAAWPQARDVRDPRAQGNVYAPPTENVGGPPSPRNSARGQGSNGSVPAQPRWATRTTPPGQPGQVASPMPGSTAYRSESPAGAAVQSGSLAAPSRRTGTPRSEITTPRGVRRPSQDRFAGKTGTEGYAGNGPGPMQERERDRDRSAQHERDRSVQNSTLDDRPGPGTPGAGPAAFAAGPQAGEPGSRSARTSFGASGGSTASGGVTASASGGSRTGPTGIGSPGSSGQNRSGRLPSPPRFSNKNPAMPGQPPSARPLTTASHTGTGPSSARGSFPASSSSRGGSHSLSTRAAYSMNSRSQTPPAAQDAASRNQTPSRSSTTSARGQPSKSTPTQSQTDTQQLLQQSQSQQTQQQTPTQPSPRTPVHSSQGPQPFAAPGAGVSQPSQQLSATQPGAASSQTPPSAPGGGQQQSIPGTPPQIYQQPATPPPAAAAPGQQLPGQQLPGAGTAPPGSTAAALAALRARRPYGVGDGPTPRSETNTPRGQTSPAMTAAASSGSTSARGTAPQVGQPPHGTAQQHGLPRWPGAGAAEPNSRSPPGAADRPSPGERPQPDRPLSSRVAPTTDLEASLPSTFAPLSARDAAAAPLSSREAREDRRAAFDTLRTSSRPPRLIMQELQRVLAAQRVASKQASPLTLRCQWLSLKFDVEVAPLDRLGSIHAVRARRTNGEPWQYKDVCNRLLAELRIA